MDMRTSRQLGLRAVPVVALALLVAGCGLRVSKTRLDAARRGPQVEVRSAGAADGGSGENGSATPAGGATPTASTPSGQSAPGQGVAASHGATPGGSTVSSAVPTTAAPPGGNGGATDTGVTADSITVGNVSTLSGPIPGLFQGAVVGAQAFLEYANSLGGVYGRKLKLDVRDDQFDAGQNNAQTKELIGHVAAFLGSFSTYDDEGAPTIKGANVADVGYALTDGRRNLPQNFSPQPAHSGTYRTGQFLYYARKFPDAVKAMGTIYGDIPASKGSALDSMAAAQSVGWKFVYQRGYQPTEVDFTADVVRMRQAGVRGVYTIAADTKSVARLLKAMQQQNFKPDFIGFGAGSYDASLPVLAGDAAEGVYIDQQLAAYQGADAAAVPEVALMDQWVNRVKPGFKPDLYTAYSWASGRILLQALQAVGPNLTRAGLIGALQKIDNFDANGLVAPAGPGSKRAPICNMFMQLKNGVFTRIDPPGKGYICEGTIFGG